MVDVLPELYLLVSTHCSLRFPRRHSRGPFSKLRRDTFHFQNFSETAIRTFLQLSTIHLQEANNKMKGAAHILGLLSILRIVVALTSATKE